MPILMLPRVLEHTGGVDDGGEGVFGRYAGQECGQRLSVGGVAGRDLHGGAECGEFVVQLGGAGCVGAAA